MSWKEIPNCYGLKHPVRDDGACPPPTPGDVVDAEVASYVEPTSIGPVGGHHPVSLQPMPGRNDPCPCGSGLKFKKCCGRRS